MTMPTTTNQNLNGHSEEWLDKTDGWLAGWTDGGSVGWKNGRRNGHVSGWKAC